MTRATPGDRIRITVDQFGAPVGSVAEVTTALPDRVYYLHEGDGFIASHDSYEVIAA